MATDLTWRIRRAAARWLFTDRRMELVAEEVGLYVGEYESDKGFRVPTWNEELHAFDYTRMRKQALRSRIRQIDVLGLTRAHHATSTKRPTGLTAIEVKVSQGDLASGIRKGQIGNGPGGIGSIVDRAYLLVAEGVRINVAALPDGWGVLTAREVDAYAGDDEPRRKAIAIDITRPARRLTPTVAVDHDLVARTLAQSALWRLYGRGTELVVRRYSEAFDSQTGRYRDREVAVG